MKRNIVILSIILIAITAIGIFYVFNTNRRTHINIDRQRYPITGIDISAHNGEINFSQVAESGIQFVYIKATEGATFKDARFQYNYKNARKAGLKVGVYHFFRFNIDGKSQALNIINSIKGKNIDLPIAIDIEEYTNNKKISTDIIISRILSLIKTLNDNKLPFILYTNKKGFRRFIKNYLKDYPLWICSFSNPPINSDWLIWQHSHKGSIKGISGDTDLNTFNGSTAEWEKWLNSFSLQLQ